jgi:methyl-accepting chemotaxis protein
MQNFGLGRLLQIVVILPILVLAAFGSVLVLETLGTYREIERLVTLERLVSAASTLASSRLNQESAASQAFVASGGEAERAEMAAARRRSDDAIRAFREAAATVGLSDPKAIELIGDIDRRLSALEQFRAKSDARTLQRSESGDFLQPITARLAELFHRIAVLVDHDRLSELLLGLYAITEMNEGQRAEAGRTGTILATGSMDPVAAQIAIVGQAKQDIFSKQFDDFGPASVRDQLSAFAAGPDGRTIQALRPVIMAVSNGGKVSEQDAGRWRAAMAARNRVWSAAIDDTRENLTAATEVLRNGARARLALYLGACLLSIALVLILSRFVLRAVRGLLGDLTQAMQALAQGRLSIEIPSRGRSDEIGVMARTVEIFKQNAVAMRALEEERSQQEERAAAGKRAALHELADTFEAEVSSVVRTVAAAASQLQQNANLMNAAAGETNRQSTLVAAAAEQAIGNVRTVATAAEELSSSIDEIGQQASAATKITASAVSQAGTTTEMVQSLVTAVERIGEVIELISMIASQTNLLALNATIEAARAGESGRGFAVVAAEVKNLASQTARATEEITTQINAIQGGTNEVVQAIETISVTIREINTISAAIASAVEQQNATTAEIARNADQAAHGSREVSGNIGTVTAAAADTGRVSKDILQSAVALTNQSETLRAGVDAFIARVRAA